MVIYSGIIALNYNPVTDILETSMPNIKAFSMSEVEYCLDLIVECVRNYHVTNLLLDSSKSVVEVDNEAYQSIVSRFTADLMRTDLKRLARIETADANREEKSAQASELVRQKYNLPIEFKNFATQAEALAWLMER